jgi:hypothetical protein
LSVLARLFILAPYHGDAPQGILIAILNLTALSVLTVMAGIALLEMT